MAYIRCESGSKTPSMVETTLWTNASPTADFAEQDITLSDDINNYDYIEFVWCANKTHNSVQCKMLVPLADWLITSAATSAANKTNVILGGNTTSADGARCGRTAGYVNATKLHFRTAHNISGSGYTNSCAIPLYVKGVKLS